MLLINPYRFSAPRELIDADAISYIAAVETADGQTLEDSIKYAYEDFILGCKSDGIWSAIKASCILAGARTLNGALVPLAGTAPTNNNFVSADYNRDTGLKGNGSTKNLNSNRNNNADPKDSQHVCVYISETYGTATSAAFHDGGGNGSTRAGFNPGSFAACRNNTSTGSGAKAVSLYGVSRNISSQFVIRLNNKSVTHSRISETPKNANLFIFSAPSNTLFLSDRLSFYSVGESLDLAALDSRVSTLMTDLAAAIP